MDKYIKSSSSNENIQQKNENFISNICQFQFKLFKEENITFEEFLEFTNVKELVEISLRRNHPKNIEGRLKKVGEYAKKVYKSCQSDPLYLSKTTTFLNLQYKRKPWLRQDIDNHEGTREVKKFSNLVSEDATFSKEMKRKKPGPKSKTIKKNLINNKIEGSKRVEKQTETKSVTSKTIPDVQAKPVGKFDLNEVNSEMQDAILTSEVKSVFNKTSNKPGPKSIKEQNKNLIEFSVNNELQEEYKENMKKPQNESKILKITNSGGNQETNINFHKTDQLIKYGDCLAFEGKNDLDTDESATTQIFNVFQEKTKFVENINEKIVPFNKNKMLGQQIQSSLSGLKSNASDLPISEKIEIETCKEKYLNERNNKSNLQKPAKSPIIVKKYQKLFERCNALNLTEEFKLKVITRYETELKKRRLNDVLLNKNLSINDSDKDKIFKMSLKEFKTKTNIAELICNTRRSRIGEKIALIDLEKCIKAIYETFIKESIWVENLKLDSHISEHMPLYKNMEYRNIRTGEKIMSDESENKMQLTSINDATTEICVEQNNDNIGLTRNFKNSENLTKKISNKQTEKLDNHKNIQVSCSKDRNITNIDKEINNEMATLSQNSIGSTKNQNHTKKLQHSAEENENISSDILEISVKKEHNTQYSNYSDEVSILSQEMNKSIIIEDDEMEDINEILKEMMSSSPLEMVSVKASLTDDNVNEKNSLTLNKKFSSKNGTEIDTPPKIYMKSNTLEQETQDFFDFGCKSAPCFSNEILKMNTDLKIDLITQPKCFQNNNSNGVNHQLLSAAFQQRVRNRRQFARKIMQNALSNVDEDIFSTLAEGNLVISSNLNSNFPIFQDKIHFDKEVVQKPEYQCALKIEEVSEKSDKKESEEVDYKKYLNLDFQNDEHQNDKNERTSSCSTQELLSTLLNNCNENTETV
ncbi:uncharacterized protein LOC129605433 [Condylostylus longicornis]|uniref:uncharacterized protein LOC129605433 n=1 Tax=Condylostylus longicornis TaxID=2530218 RepID=UPI00244E0524|nr:uncharacterized protein LOC129605433 [Condylostylus longicornis]